MTAFLKCYFWCICIKKNALSFSDQQGVVSCFLLGGLLMFEPQNNLVRAESVLPSCGQKPTNFDGRLKISSLSRLDFLSSFSLDRDK